MEAIGVLGGSFNPPQHAHIRLVESISKYFSKILVIPCGDRPDKAGLVSSRQRLEMTKIAFRALAPKVEVSTTYSGDIEVQNGVMIPSYYLLTRLMQEHPNETVKMIIGSDLVPTLPRWIQAEKLLEECHFFVVPRLSFEIPAEYRNRPNIEVLQDASYEPSGKSSTFVRTLISEEADVASILTETTRDVLDYIQEHGLFGARREAGRSVS